MSRSLNRASLIGNLGADPEVRTVGAGNRVASFSLATSRSWNGADGTPHERTDWHRVVVWGAAVEVVEQYLRKGERVFVEGEIQYRSYDNPQGVTRNVAEINAREILLLGGRGPHAGVDPISAGAQEKGRGTVRPRRAAAVSARADLDDDLPF